MHGDAVAADESATLGQVNTSLGGYVTLGTAQTITAQKTFTTSGSSDTMIISHGSGSGFALDVIKAGNGEAIRVQKTSGSGNAMTISGGDFEAGPAKFGGTVRPTTNMIADLGSGSIRWSTLFGRNIDLTEGAIIGGFLSAQGISSTAPANAISLLLNGRSADNVGIIAFGANTGGGQYNFIQSSPTSLIVGSRGATPIEFHTNVNGGGGPRLTITGTGAAILTGSLTGTTANLNPTGGNTGLNITASGSAPSIELRGNTDNITAINFYNNAGTTLRNYILSTETGFNLSSQGNTPLTFGTNGGGGGGTRMTISGSGDVTLTGALNGTSAAFTLNQNAVSTISLTNSDNTNTTSRARYLVTSGTVEATITSISTLGAFLGTNSNHDLNLITNGATRLLISSSTGAATFSSSVTAGGTIRMSNAVVNRAVIIGVDSASEPSIQAVVNNSDVPRQLSINPLGGNVGIGTDIPGRALEVLRSGSATAQIKFGDASTSKGYLGVFSNAVYITAGGTFNSGWTTDGTNGIATIVMETANGGSAITFETASSNTSSTERMRITRVGYLKASNNGNYFQPTSPFHEIRQTISDNILVLTNSAGSDPYGIGIGYDSAPNNSGNNFFRCFDGSFTTLRAEIRSNGGIANYATNNVVLSDERLKKDIEPLESYWDKFKAIEIVKYKYIDQTHDDFNIGVIAQQVEAIAPEFVDLDGWGTKPELDQEGNQIVSEEEPLKSVYASDLHHATIKVLQEAMAKIEKLEEEISSLKNQIK
jgi:hypothetical protein